MILTISDISSANSLLFFRLSFHFVNIVGKRDPAVSWAEGTASGMRIGLELGHSAAYRSVLQSGPQTAQLPPGSRPDFRMPLSLLGLHQGVPTSYLLLETPTEAFLSVDGCKIRVLVRDEGFLLTTVGLH